MSRIQICTLTVMLVAASRALAGELEFRFDPAAPPALGMLAQDESSAEAESSLEPLAGADDGWTVDVQPYIWIPASIKGDSTVAGTTAKLDLNFSDIIDDFDKIFALTARVEAWKGDWGLIFDGMYVSIEGSFDIEPPGGGPISPNVDVDISQSIVDLAVGWRILERPIDAAAPDGPRFRVDLIGGMRYQYLKQEISPGPINLGTSKDWVEIMIGGRVAFRVNEKLAFALRADASGFGIGSGSNLTWNVLAGGDWRFTETFDLKVGYRWFDIDYDNGSGLNEFGMDVRMHGPYIGASFTF